MVAATEARARLKRRAPRMVATTEGPKTACVCRDDYTTPSSTGRAWHG